MAAARGALHTAVQAESSELFNFFLGEGYEDNADSSNVLRLAQLGALPSARDNKEELEREHAADMSSTFYYGSTDLLLQRPPDTPAITSGRAAGPDGPTGWCVSIPSDRRLTRSITTGSAALDSFAGTGAYSPSDRSPSFQLCEAALDQHCVQQLIQPHLHPYKISDSAWSCPRQNDPPAAQLCAPFSPTDLCNHGADADATPAGASLSGRGPPGPSDPFVASSHHHATPVTSNTTAPATAAVHMMSLESSGASAGSSAAAVAASDAPAGAEGPSSVFPSGARGMPFGPAYPLSCAPAGRHAYAPQLPPPHYTGLHAPAPRGGGSFPSSAAAAAAAANTAGANRHPSGGPGPVVATATATAAATSRPGAWLRGAPPSHGSGPEATASMLPPQGYYDAAGLSLAAATGTQLYLDYGDAVTAPAVCSSLSGTRSTPLSCGPQESGSGGGGALGLTAAPPLAATQQQQQQLPSSTTATSPTAGGDVASPVQQPQAQSQLHPHSHAHAQPNVDVAAHTETNGGGHGAAVPADARMYMPQQQHASMPWPPQSKASYKNAATAAATASTTAAADLPGTPPSSALSPSSCSSGPPGPSLEPAVPSASPYIPYHPSVPPPPPHLRHNPPHLPPYYHHRTHMYKRYAWADGYNRYDPAYVSPYWSSPYYHTMPICRTGSWHGILAPGANGLMGGPHTTGARVAADPAGGSVANGGGSGCMQRVSVPPGVRHAASPMLLPDKPLSQLQPQQPGSSQLDVTTPIKSAAAAPDMYGSRGSGGGHRPPGPMYGRAPPMLFPSPPAPYPAGMRGGVAQQCGGSSSSGGATIVTRFMRSSSVDSLSLLQAPMPMPGSARDFQHQQLHQRGMSEAVGVKEEPLNLGLGAMELAASSTPPPPMLETRESFKRRRLTPSWSLPGPLVSATSALQGLMQPTPLQASQLQPQLSTPGDHSMPDLTLGSAALAEKSFMPPSPFAFGAQSVQAAVTPTSAPPVSNATMVPGCSSSTGQGPHTQGSLQQLPPPAGSSISLPGTSRSTVGLAGLGVPAAASASASTTIFPAGSSFADAAAVTSGVEVGIACGSFGAAPMDEDPSNTADLEDSFEAFASKLGFDDLDICMSADPEEPTPAPPLQQPPQQIAAATAAATAAVAVAAAAAPLPSEAVPAAQGPLALAAAAVAAAPACPGGVYGTIAGGSAPAAPDSRGTVAAAATAAAVTSPRVLQQPRPAWALPGMASPGPPRQGQGQQPQPQPSTSDEGPPLSAWPPSPLLALLPAHLQQQPLQQQQEQKQLEQQQHQLAVGGLVVNADPSANKCQEPVLLPPALLLPSPVPLPPALPAAGVPPPRGRGGVPRRLNGNSSRAMRSQCQLLQLGGLDQLPGPVRVTVAGAGSSRSTGDSGARRGGTRSVRRGSDGGASDDDDVEDAADGSGGARGSSTQGVEMKGTGGGCSSVQGMFHVKPYLEGRKCIEHSGEMVSRSAFERAGGSMMAKWYRSIKVIPEGISLGKWLVNNGLPVLKGNPRRSKKGSGAGPEAEPT